MKLTSFGFVAIAENFLKDALSAPPSTGGKWSLKRFTNFTENSSSLQILLTSDSGTQKTSALLHSRMTGASRESSIQGWIQYGEDDSREPFVIKASEINRAEEEIFEIVDQLVGKIPEAEKSAFQSIPKPTPSSGFEPLLPEIQNSSASSATEEAFDPASLIAQMNADAAKNAEPAPEEEPASGLLLSPEVEEPASGPLLSPEIDEPQEEAPAEATKAAKAVKGSKKTPK
jgi:hypothetical protein